MPTSLWMQIVFILSRCKVFLYLDDKLFVMTGPRPQLLLCMYDDVRWRTVTPGSYYQKAIDKSLLAVLKLIASAGEFLDQKWHCHRARIIDDLPVFGAAAAIRLVHGFDDSSNAAVSQNLSIS